MIVNIRLNDLKYRIDVYNIFNIYFSLDEIKFNEEKTDYIVEILEKKVIFRRDSFLQERVLGEDKKSDIKKCLFEGLKIITEEEYPWGILVGIRPSKIALKWIKYGKSKEEIVEIFKEKYLAKREKAELAFKVANFEKDFLKANRENVSIYIGMAFCPTRCVYCSFSANPIGSNKSLVEPYLKTLKKEIKEIKDYIDSKGLKVETVYFGGGTPTAISDEQFRSLMREIHVAFIQDRKVKEFTVECGRPDSITRKKLETMKDFRVDRISINPQTMNDKTLALIGRGHTSQDIKDVYKIARDIGFDDINMDMIIGLPGEGVEEVKKTVREIEKLKPDSLTIHGLSIKRASALYEMFILKKGIGIKEQAEVLKMYKESETLAKTLKIKPYYMYRQKNMVGNMENLGYARKGKECIYNMQMIEERQTIIALGADGVSKIIDVDTGKIQRFPNIKGVREYIKRIDEMVEGKKEMLDTVYK